MPHNRTSTDSVLQLCQPTATHPNAASRLAERSATCRAVPVAYEALRQPVVVRCGNRQRDMPHNRTSTAHSVLQLCQQQHPTQTQRLISQSEALHVPPVLPNPSMGGGDGMRSVWVWLHHASCVTSTTAVCCRRPYLSSLCASTSKSKGLAAVACGSRPVLQ